MFDAVKQNKLATKQTMNRIQSPSTEKDYAWKNWSKPDSNSLKGGELFAEAFSAWVQGRDRLPEALGKWFSNKF